MANTYYTHTTYPVANSQGASSGMRAELNAVTAGFDLLPPALGVGQQGFNGGNWQNAALNAGSISGTWTGAPTFSGTPVFTFPDINGGTIDGAVIGGAVPAAASFTSLTSDATALGAVNTETITNTTSGTGVGLKMVGDGATTPSKTLRVQAGVFGIANDAFSQTLLSLTDAGSLTTSGGINSTAIGNVTPAAASFTTLGANAAVAFSGGGALSGTYTGSPTFSGNPNFSGNPTYAAIALAGAITFNDGTTTNTAPQPNGQCRLSLSGGNLLLTPYNGNELNINGALQRIPSAGVSLSPTGAAVNTYYNIYAFMSGTTMTLEFSTTGHSNSSATGVEIKTGDPTRTLVGAAYCIVANAWAFNTTQLLVLSWFNRKRNRGISTTSSAVMSGTSQSELGGGANRVSFITWGDESVHVDVNSQVNTSVAGVTTPIIGAAFDGNIQNNLANTIVQAGAIAPISTGGEATLSAGALHYACAFGEGGSTSTPVTQVTVISFTMNG